MNHDKLNTNKANQTMRIYTDTTFRQALLSIFLSSLIVTSGCAGLLPAEGGLNEEETSKPMSIPEEKHTNGTDLRSISVPENGSVTVSGELDRGDPKEGKKFYEPVQAPAVEGQVVNVTMEAESGNPKIRIVNPDGNVTRTVSNVSENVTEFVGKEFSQSGCYTFETTSADQNATFNYTLTIERIEPNRSEQGDELFEQGEKWNETEHYLKYGEQFAEEAEGHSPYDAQFPTNASKDGLRANATGDYLVLTYEFSSEYNYTLKNGIDATFMATYTNLREKYIKYGNDTSTTTNVTWVPDIIFFKGVDNETGDLLRTTFLTEEWAKAYGEHGNTYRYGGSYYSTLKYGSGSQFYESGSAITDDKITDDEFPQVYHNYTYPSDNSTLAERYGL